MRESFHGEEEKKDVQKKRGTIIQSSEMNEMSKSLFRFAVLRSVPPPEAITHVCPVGHWDCGLITVVMAILAVK